MKTIAAVIPPLVVCGPFFIGFIRELRKGNQ